MAEEESMAFELQDEFESKARGFGKGKYGRIIKMARTPSRDEYKKTLYMVDHDCPPHILLRRDVT